MQSSILKLFSKEHYQQKEPPEGKPKRLDGSDCFGCTATSAALLLGLGSALATGIVFQTKDGKPLPNASPRYIKTMRGIGAILIPLGLFRSWQSWKVYREEHLLD